ncbi:SIMPL domain-containing protein [Haloarculaceae archaeon H-GB2-1]|nr:SIMPL domain-containing protein [Haloarculaceae archaeon H-GB1-1]MEA5388862.1 SIMPL domain-containing protein [Haloarculaceae archaeon H-GB11]MEA5406919.1 SIMPL domain-containing protein [Haloarculaceae archaeon H-GB2-1]
MRTKTAFGTVLVAVVLVTAAVAGTVVTSDGASAQADEQGDRTITVGANGQVQSTADQAVVEVAVVTSAADVTTARNRLSENVTAMREALSAMGIGADQVRTQYFDINEDYRERKEDGQTRYRAIHSFQITLENTSRSGEVIDAAVNNGANRVDGVEFTLSREKRQDLRQQALEDAMDSARQQANTVAGSGGLTVTGVSEISTTEYNSSPVRYEAAAMTADGGGTSVESGPVTVTASVQVVYNATAN